MKKKNKIILITAVILSMLTLLSLTAFADDSSDRVEPVVDETVIGEEAIEGPEAPRADEGEENVFDDIYATLTENADKILAALAFVGTMTVSFAYKKGLIPLLGNAISSLKCSVDSIKENGTALVKSTDDRFLSLCENMESVRECNDATARSIDEINVRLDGMENVTKNYEKIKFVLESQIDMLYTIFISSSLPQYQKEEVGAKINQMKEELMKYE